MTAWFVIVLLAMTIISGSLSALAAPQQDAMATMTPPASTNQGLSASFAINLFRRIAKDNASKNVLISPYSASTCLSMAYIGAEGGTKEAMAAVLGLNGTDEQILAHAKQTIDSLRKPGGDTILEVADALYASKSVKFKQSFLDACKKHFDAQINSVDFAAPDTLNQINGWANEHTHGKIPQILEQVPSGAVLCLLNAVYFKGMWEKKFSKALTKPQDFHTTDDTVKKVAMMHAERNDFSYAENENFKAVRLPYNDGRLSLYVFLPSNLKPLPLFEAEMTGEKWNEWMKMFHRNKGSLSMPRFKIEDSMELNDPLTKLGMGIAFSKNDANFLEMADPGPDGYLYINQVLQKTCMDVNEEGTEAAAVTSTMMFGGSMNAPIPFNMVVDKPFIVALRDDTTGAVLFMGHIVDPPAAQ